MLSPQEALLLQAARDEQARQESMQAAGLTGAIGGAAIGAIGGQPLHMFGNAINATKDSLAARQGLSAAPNRMRGLKAGPRMAGGLVGMILGGGLGAGMSAIMQRGSTAGELLGKLQAQGGELNQIDEMRMAQELGKIYQNPSSMM